MPQYTAQKTSVSEKVFRRVCGVEQRYRIKKYKQNRNVGKLILASETANKERKPSHINKNETHIE